MGCRCDDAACRRPVYGEALLEMVERGRDCTIVDAGCGGRPWLREMQRHLLRHGIAARTVALDVEEQNAVADVFVLGDLRSARIGEPADAIVFRNVEPFFKTRRAFREAFAALAGFMKPDGLLFTATDEPEDVATRSMTRGAALAHSRSCFGSTLGCCHMQRPRLERRLNWIDSKFRLP